MIAALTLTSAGAFNCTQNPEACADGARARDLINQVMGPGTIADGGKRPFRLKTAFLQKKFAQIRNAAEADGCTISDVVGGAYAAGSGTWLAERETSMQSGHFGGGMLTGSDDEGFDLGATHGVFADHEMFADVHGSTTGFQAGVYQRTAGNTGYVAFLLGVCPGSAAAAMDTWYDGDLVEPELLSSFNFDRFGSSSGTQTSMRISIQHVIDPFTDSACSEPLFFETVVLPGDSAPVVWTREDPGFDAAVACFTDGHNDAVGFEFRSLPGGGAADGGIWEPNFFGMPDTDLIGSTITEVRLVPNSIVFTPGHSSTSTAVDVDWEFYGTTP